MKMEVTQSSIIVECMLCFYKIIGTFLSSHKVDNWASYSKCSRMILLHLLLLNMNCWVYFYYGIMCDVFIAMPSALYEMPFVLYNCCIMLDCLVFWLL